MEQVPFAFSVHHFIQSVGADAGFASIIGLAILVLLYFAHAREVSSLREQNESAGQRIEQLEAAIRRVGTSASAGQVTMPPVAPAPRPAPPPNLGGSGAPSQSPSPAVAAGTQSSAATPSPAATPTSAPAMAAATTGEASPKAAQAESRPAAPAGTGAPALTAATRLIPAGAGAAEQRSEPMPPPATVAAGASTPNGELHEEDHQTIAPSPTPVAGSDVVSDSRGSAGAAAGAAVAAAARPTASRAASGRTMPSPQSAGGRAAPPPRRPGSGAPYSQLQPPRSRLRRILPILIGLLALAVVVGVLLLLTSSNGSTPSKPAASPASSNAPASHPRAPGPAAAPSPSATTVAVLNGTATSGLAHRVAVKLGGAGYKQGTVATATDQTRTATIIAYLPGDKHRALSVASLLKLGPASVQPIDAATRAIACPPPARCSATVVVTVGSDLSSTP